jgi:cytochrome P450
MSVALSKIDTAPERLPVVGHVPALIRQPMTFLQGLRAQGDLVRIFLGPHPVYVATSASVVRQVVVDHGSVFRRGRLFDKAKALVGNGLATSDGSFHRQQRRIMQPAFHRKRIAGYLDVMREQTLRLTDGWAAGHSMDLDKEMAELALTVTAKSLFRAELGQQAACASGTACGLRQARSSGPMWTVWRR